MGVDLDRRGGGEELGRTEGEKTVIRKYYMRKKSIFNKRKNCKREKYIQTNKYIHKRKYCCVGL